MIIVYNLYMQKQNPDSISETKDYAPDDSAGKTKEDKPEETGKLKAFNNGMLMAMTPKKMTRLSAVYVLAMVILGTCILIVNQSGLFASIEGYTEVPTGVNALLWSFVAVFTFVFALCIIYFVSAQIRRRRQVS